jgi:hypothetical protein
MRGQGWKAYPAAALSKGLADGLRSPREAARRAKALIRSRGSLSSAGFGLAPSLLPMRDLLGIVFPVIAYDLAEPEFRSLARAVVGGPDDPEGLRLAFLRAWGVHGDPNFEAAARKLGIELRGGHA